MLLTSYRHESGHYIVVPRAEQSQLQPLAREMEFLGEMDLERFAGDVRAKILRGRARWLCVRMLESARVHEGSREDFRAGSYG